MRNIIYIIALLGLSACATTNQQELAKLESEHNQILTNIN